MTREEWAWIHSTCFICGRDGTDVHEIARGSHRAAAVAHPAAWLKLCRLCHRDAVAAMPVARQLAYKMVHDPEHYNRLAVNNLRRRAPNAISEQEVAAEVAHLFRTTVKV